MSNPTFEEQSGLSPQPAAEGGKESLGSAMNTNGQLVASSDPAIEPTQTNGQTSKNSPKGNGRHRTLKIVLRSAFGLLIAGGLALAIIYEWFPNVLVESMVEPNLKSWMHARLGDKYSLEIASITVSANRDSLYISGVRIARRPGLAGAVGTLDSSILEQMTIDTIRVAGVDYAKLLLMNGLFSGSITVRSPKIYLRPGAIPTFASTEHILPSFLPIVSSKLIQVENAEIYVSDDLQNSPSPASQTADQSGHFVIQKASFTLRDFYIDESTAHTGSPTFFSKSATFDASDISHANRNGLMDIAIQSIHGDLLDSTLDVERCVADDPTTTVRRSAFQSVEIRGLDWNKLLSGRGLLASRVTINSAECYLQDNFTLAGGDATKKLTLPRGLPLVSVGTVAITNGEVMNILPGTRKINELKHVSLVLRDLSLDTGTLASGVTSLFSRDANFSIKGVTEFTTKSGHAEVSDVHGSLKDVSTKRIALLPTTAGVKRVALASTNLHNIDWNKLLTRKGLYAGSIVLGSPTVELARQSLTGADPPDDSKDPLLRLRKLKAPPMPEYIPVVAAGTISVTNGTLTGLEFFDGSASPQTGLTPQSAKRYSNGTNSDTVSNVTLSLKNFRLDPAAWTTTRGSLFSSSAHFSFGSLTHYTSDGLYRFTEHSVVGDIAGHSLVIDTVAMMPMIPVDSFGSVMQSREERVAFVSPKVVLAGFDFHKLLFGQGLYADSVFVHNWLLDLYSDKRAPEATHDSDLYPHEAFQHVTTLFDLKSIVMESGTLKFQDQYPDHDSVATLTLSNIDARISPFSNDLSAITRTTPTDISGTLDVFGTGRFRFNIAYALMDTTLSLTAQGRLDTMGAPLFNDYVVQAESFKLLGGELQSVQVALDVHGKKLHVKTFPLYDDLSVAYYKGYSLPGGFVIPAGLATFLGNVFWIRPHNTIEKDHPPHSGEVDADMDRAESFWWSLWLPMRESVNDVLGIPDKVW